MNPTFYKGTYDPNQCVRRGWMLGSLLDNILQLSSPGVGILITAAATSSLGLDMSAGVIYMQDKWLQGSERKCERKTGRQGRKQNDGGTDFTVAERTSSGDQGATECESTQTPVEIALLTTHIPPPQDSCSYHITTHTAKEHTVRTDSGRRKEVSIAIALEGDNLDNKRGTTVHWTALKSSSSHSSAAELKDHARFPNCAYFFLLSTKPLVSGLCYSVNFLTTVFITQYVISSTWGLSIKRKKLK